MGVEYEGTRFAGWQIQPNQRTVQGCLQHAIGTISSYTGKVVAAGRTDSGVHALSQVIHFDTPSARSERNWILGMNSHLPSDINVIWAREVETDFSARFSAVRRSYRYLLINRIGRSSIYADNMWWLFKTLDEQCMQDAADLLVGYHDFSAFRAKDCQAKNTMKNIELIKITRRGHLIAIDIVAKSFLHRMVRNIVGVLVLIGEKTRPVSWAKLVLESRDRGQGGVTSPPQGLYFVNVEYPTQYLLPTVSDFSILW
ncbi:MAG: tRNA pseudouridine(38-40) synthase TruA [Anaerolineales bacterium]|nr:tRNA pseudouridine(38-40) synthase TruA [Anaerolineales bacterium]